MDVLSSQSNLAGYVAVIESAKELKSALPMMMTAAGTLKPASVFCNWSRSRWFASNCNC